MQLRLQASPLRSIIQGKSGGVKTAGTVVLDASKSVDPDDPQGTLDFAWSCYHEDFPKACFGNATADKLPRVVGSRYVIPAGSMDSGKWHKIELLVSKGNYL